MDEEIKGYNIAFDIIGNRCVSTGAVPNRFSYYRDSLLFETIIWFWDGSERKNILHMINHKSEYEAKKIHGYIVSNLTNGKRD